MRPVARWSVGALALTAACVGRGRDSFGPIPDVAWTATAMRGAPEAALDQFEQPRIIGTLIRDFFRPVGGQARWVDGRALPHLRSAVADSLEERDELWAESIVRATGIGRVCVHGPANAACDGRPGGVLRFSRVYAAGRDSARVFARYSSPAMTSGSEMGFLLVRRDGQWTIASKGDVPRPAGVVTPASVANELEAADRHYGSVAPSSNGVDALAAMLSDSVILPTATGFVRGLDAAVAELRRNPQNAASRLEWAPIRVGVSADGRHGFTFGYMTQRVGDSTHVLKYLAYWVRGAEGWRVLTYRRRRAAPGAQTLGPMPPSLPRHLVPATSDSAVLAPLGRSLSAAERSFSDTAQRIGLGAAFEMFGRADAVNMGGPNTTDFVVGSPAIGRAVGAGTPTNASPVTWSADYDVVVASSGDLGVTFGVIRRNEPSGGVSETGFPFFTIWRRDGPSSPWRYIAE